MRATSRKHKAKSIPNGGKNGTPPERAKRHRGARVTYLRPASGFSAAITRAKQLLGEEWLAERLGLSTSRLRQAANPMRPDGALALRHALAIDLAAAREGQGTPIFESYRDQLMAQGALRPGASDARLIGCLRALAAMIAAALAPFETQPQARAA
jgi:hypothetical protein